MPKLIWARLPKAGLGNKLLVWARAQVIAKQQAAPVYPTHWVDLNWGAMLRRERSKRFYAGYFKQPSWKSRLGFWRYRWSKPLYEEPFDIVQPTGLYKVTKLFVEPDYFHELRPERNWLIQRIRTELKTEWVNAWDRLPAPEIAVHIRRGDFKFGQKLTPLLFFESVITAIREQQGREVPVLVFSDANDNEINTLLAMPGVKRSSNTVDLLDMLQMAKSTVLVMSVNSTFSFWAGFLGDGLLIRSPEEYNPPINRLNTTEPWRELVFDSSNRTSRFYPMLNEVFSTRVV